MPPVSQRHDGPICIDRPQGVVLTHAMLLACLADAGYVRVPMVTEPGEMSVRGAIVDVFPVNQSHPLRFEYDGDRLERLGSFMVATQRTLSVVQTTTILPTSQQKDVLYHQLDGPQSAITPGFYPGSYVVHSQFGVARFDGLVRLSVGQSEAEYLCLQYKGEDRCYVPLDQLACVTPYTNPGPVTLNGLHDGEWNRTKKRVKKALETLCYDMVLMAKARQDTPGIQYNPDTAWQVELEQSFGFSDTLDQRRVTAEIKRDMESPYPMDRLVCGDVGFGKTELMVRAAFKACENGQQVAIVVPTTILAHQHGRTLAARFAGFPYRLGVLSRFKSKSEQRALLADLQSGILHVVVGTHRLLQQDVAFQSLGLVVIDEEQRFGVAHKERLKALRLNVDVLSLSATPIPRTLFMALTGAKSYSTLATPPTRRLPVKTLVKPYDASLIQLVIQTELDRGGQVYFLCNHVQGIPQRVQALQRLLPAARIGWAHGQMSKQALEDTMMAFWDGQLDVLVCSTIIENGVDVPNANTIIIDDAHHLGLSQLHQLRGRVGRSDRQGVALLLIASDDAMTDDARRRLTAIREYAALGSGSTLAMKDLEIRGAGTMLGKRQHGHMTAVGFELYAQLLEEVAARWQGKPLRRHPTWLETSRLSMLIPEDYISDEPQRLAMYQRLATVTLPYQLDDLVQELIDRYGPLPDAMSLLVATIRIELDRLSGGHRDWVVAFDGLSNDNDERDGFIAYDEE